MKPPAPGATVRGVVVAVERWGMQVRLDSGILGFIDVADASDTPAPMSNWPTVGAEVTAQVKRYTTRGQLRLTLRASDAGRPKSPVLRVHDSAIDYDEDLVYTYRGERFTGVGYDEDPTTGRSEITYRDGAQTGPARDWYPTGELKVEEFYQDGLLHGPSREYRPDGSLRHEKTYEHGILIQSRTDPAGNGAARRGSLP